MSGIIAGGIAGVGALGKIAYGAIQNHQANKIDEANIRPVETVQPEYEQNVRTAEQMAQQGIPQQSYNNQVNAINRNQAGALMTLGRSANPGANLASIVRAGNDANNNLNAEDAMQRNRNTLALIQQRGILAQQKQNTFNYNYKDKYSENLAKSQALRGAETQNISGGLTDLGQIGSMYAMAQSGNPTSQPYGTPDPSSQLSMPANPGMTMYQPKTPSTLDYQQV
jgi:hypothetical protein